MPLPEAGISLHTKKEYYILRYFLKKVKKKLLKIANLLNDWQFYYFANFISKKQKSGARLSGLRGYKSIYPY